MNILLKIKNDLAKKVNKAAGEAVVFAADFVYPPNAEMGDLSLACFGLAKKRGENPADTARILAGKIKADKTIAAVKAAGPYLNFVLENGLLANRTIGVIARQKKKYGFNKKAKKKRVMIEFANMNTHKEVHIGHMRNIAYGDAAARLIAANGDTAIPVSYINDFGIHVAKTLWFYKNHFKKSELAEMSWDSKGALLGRVYAEATKKIDENEDLKQEVGEVMKNIESRQGDDYKLWEKTRKWNIRQFADIYKELGVKFKATMYENEFVGKGFELVKELKAKGVLIDSEGAVIADLSAYGLGVLLFLRSDSTALYPVADLPLSMHKFEKFKVDASIVVVDARQGQYFKQISKVLNLLGYEKEMLHLGYDIVKLPTGIMAARTGNIITYNQLKAGIYAQAFQETEARHKDWPEEKIAKVAKALVIGAMKFEMLKVGREQIITFDIKEALRFDGFTAAYLQYTIARINSIIRKAGITNYELRITNDIEKLTEAKEHGLVLRLAKYPEAVARAGERFDPSEIAKYLFELAQNFNDYYHSVPVLAAVEEVKNARLALIAAVSQTLKNGLELLGIEAVEEM